MLNIPEEVKKRFKEDNLSNSTSRQIKLRFYDDDVKLIFPENNLFPSDELFPVDQEPCYVIGNEQIVYESLKIIESICDNYILKFGFCEGAQFEIVVADVNQDLTGKEFIATVEIGDYEMVLGIYRVKSFVRLEADRRKKRIIAYNRMTRFFVDVTQWYNGLAFPMTLKQFRDSICSYIGVEQLDTVLPLDDLQITKTIDPSIMNGGAVIQAICEINGCFGNIDKTGRFKYVFLPNSSLFPSESLFPENDLFPSGMEDGELLSYYYQSKTTYKDFVVKPIDKIQIRQESGDIGVIYGDGNNCYTIKGNFLLYGKSSDELLQIAASIFENIRGRVYRPCTIVGPALPWIEPGDGLICYTSDDVIETFCLKRTLRGIQEMSDTFEAEGSIEQVEDFGTHTQIVQLVGKTAIIKRSVEEVSVKVSDLKDYTEAQFKITAEEIAAEVKRAQEAEAALTIMADKIALSVTDLKNDTNSRFEQTANQISLKVSKGEVSSQLSMESDKITLSGNRLIVNSTNFKLDGNGNATFSGDIRGSNIYGSYISGSTFESPVFYAGDDAVQFGDYQVSASGSNELHSINGWVQINANERPTGSPGGRFASMVLSGEGYGGVEILGTGQITCGGIKCIGIECNDIVFEDSWTAGMSSLEMLKQIYGRLDQVKRSLGLDWDN